MTTPDLPFPLGRKVEHDPLSRNFVFTAPAKLPTYSVTWPRRVPIMDQGNVGACTGFAMAGWLGTDPRADVHTGEGLALSLYSEATRLDVWPGEYPPDDTGSSGNAVCKAARNRGLITSWSHAFTFNDALAALFKGPILIGIPWRYDMFWPEDSGYLKCTGEVVGGHELMLRAIDPVKRHVQGDQTWGLPWGRGPNPDGRFWMHWNDLEALLADNGDTTIPIR